MLRTSGKTIALLLASSASVLAFAQGCGIDNSIVGGACAAPYVECDGQCILVSNDPLNCGACGNACGAGVACVEGACADLPGSGDPDAARDDGAYRPGPDGSVGGSDGSSSSDGSGVGGDGSSSSDGGGMGGDGSSSSDGGGMGGDGSVADDAGCVMPQVDCDGVCVDVSSDPSNCGTCGKVCPSNSCVSGSCTGSAAGHVVAIGHDYEVAPSPGSAQARVLGNAVLIPKSSPVNVLTFEHYAPTSDVSNVKTVVDAEAKKVGRKVSYTETSTDSDVSGNLDINTYDVLLVLDQRKASSGTLGSLGTNWASTTKISDFLNAGGVVVVLDGGTGAGEMSALMTNMGVLSVTAQTVLSAPSLTVLAPGDVVGTSVISPYVSTSSTVWFDTEASGPKVTYVVGSGSSDPVVVHKLIY